MQFVEVVRTVVTDPEVVDDVEALAGRLGKTPVVVGDKAGFIANALLFGYLNHAVPMYEQQLRHPRGHRRRDDASAAACPMGPLALLDLIGLDTAYEILDTMYKQGRDRLHAPAPLLKQMVTRGPAGPQDRPRLLHLRRSRARPVVVDDALTPRGDAPAHGPGARGARASASSAPGRWPPASSRSSPRRATTCFSWPAAPRRPRPRSTRIAAGLEQGVPSAAGSRRPTGTPRAAGSAARHRLDGPRGRRPRRRGRRRGPRRQARPCSRASTRSAGRARCSPRPRRRCP